MPREIACPKCRCTFPVTKKMAGKEIRCPVCSTVCEAAAIEPAREANPRGMKCPGCKKTFPRGVTYCASCNVSLFQSWGDTEANADKIARRAEMVSYAELAGKTLRIFLYFITLRWWKILDEF